MTASPTTSTTASFASIRLTAAPPGSVHLTAARWPWCLRRRPVGGQHGERLGPGDLPGHPEGGAQFSVPTARPGWPCSTGGFGCPASPASWSAPSIPEAAHSVRGVGERGAVRIAAGFDSLWVTGTCDEVSEIQPAWRTPQGTGDHGGPGPIGVAVGDGSVWVTNTAGGTGSRIDPTCGRVVHVTVSVGRAPGRGRGRWRGLGGGGTPSPPSRPPPLPLLPSSFSPLPSLPSLSPSLTPLLPPPSIPLLPPPPPPLAAARGTIFPAPEPHSSTCTPPPSAHPRCRPGLRIAEPSRAAWSSCPAAHSAA